MREGTRGAAWLAGWCLWLGAPALAAAQVPPCVEVETRLVRGMFLCGAHAELRVVIRDHCAEPVACVVRFDDARSEAVRVEIDPGQEVGSLVTSDRRRVAPGTTGCFDVAPDADPVEVRCELEPARALRTSLLAPPAISPLGDGPSDGHDETGGATISLEPGEHTPAAIRAADPTERALSDIPLGADDSAYRGGSWHVRFGIGAGYDVVPLYANRQALVGTELSVVTRPVLAHAVGLAVRLAVEPYRDEIVAVGLALEGGLGALPSGEGLSLVGGGTAGLTLAIGYRWVFALLDGALGGRAVGLVDALDLRGYQIDAGASVYGRARAGGGARFCLASGPHHGCPVELDLTAHWERAFLPPHPYLPSMDALLLGASLAVDGVLTASLELGWGYPFAGDAIVAPSEDLAGWMVAARLEKQFDWFGESYVAPEVPCAPDVLTGIWRTPEGDRVLLEENGDVVVVRSASVEGLARRYGDAELRIEWATDRGHAVDRLVIATPDQLVRDGEAVLTRLCR